MLHCIVSSSILRYLKLETFVYTFMYNVFTLFCMNGEHVTDQWKSGYWILGYTVQNRQVIKCNWKD